MNLLREHAGQQAQKTRRILAERFQKPSKTRATTSGNSTSMPHKVERGTKPRVRNRTIVDAATTAIKLNLKHGTMERATTSKVL